MPKLGIISDIHGNLEALQAVLADLDLNHADCKNIFSLGDVIGYGPNPVECWNLLKLRKIQTLCGNHEAALDPAEIFSCSSVNVYISVSWTRAEIENSDNGQEMLMEIESLRGFCHFEDLLLVHGSPSDVVMEYLMPDSVNNLDQMRENFLAMGKFKICFHGHTHKPGAIVFDQEDFFHILPSANDMYLKLDTDKNSYIINPGSVGQPRDGDPRASYCIFDQEENSVTWYRVTYDIEAVQKKIADLQVIPPRFAERLSEGK